MNTWASSRAINQRSPIYERATPIEVGHVVFFVKDVQACERFYASRFGFVASDRYPERGAFLRCAPEGGHHDLFLLQLPRASAASTTWPSRCATSTRCSAAACTSRCGWKTQLGPGRPVSSAYFWYFKNPAGGLVEYYADEDHLTADWQPREFEPGPTVFAEWAVTGGLDGTPAGKGHGSGRQIPDRTQRLNQQETIR
jgi:catechol 2,3-dioxygenase-like lactoylglutathione lyase family enzyme